MKITWASNAPWAATGYGTQTAQMLKRLIADGHDVAVAANHGLGGKPLRDPGTGAVIFPNAVETYGNDVIVGHHLMHTKGEPSWLITLYDVWVYTNPELATLNVASWAPVDHYPVPPNVAEWCRGHPTIAMSRFGQKALEEAGVDAMYAPHGIELDVFRPTELMSDGLRPRDVWGIPDDAFLVMVNAANKGNVPPRKSWGEMMSAVALFMRAHPDVFLYLHTELRGVYGGVDIYVLLHALGIDPERVRFPDQYANLVGIIEPSTLAALYTSADVLLATSMGEGFGIPVIEAQACGTPVIVTDFSAQPELVGAGWTVPYQAWWDFTQGSFLALPSIAGIRDRLEKAYDTRGQHTEAAIAKAAEYGADRVFDEYWRPILKTLEDKLTPPTRQQRRASRRKAA